jgi:hypothetical protein
MPQLRGNEPILGFNNIEPWIEKKKFHTLYFDGASKGNLGEAGTGGGYSSILEGKILKLPLESWDEN